MGKSSKAANAAWAKRNPEYGTKYRAQTRRRYREVRAQVVKDAKSVPCADCGIIYPHYVMDFDHVRGLKVGNISALGRDGGPKALALLLEEIAKCDVVCSNCHRLRTFREAADDVAV